MNNQTIKAQLGALLENQTIAAQATFPPTGLMAFQVDLIENCPVAAEVQRISSSMLGKKLLGVWAIICWVILFLI